MRVTVMELCTVVVRELWECDYQGAMGLQGAVGL